MKNKVVLDINQLDANLSIKWSIENLNDAQDPWWITIKIDGQYM